MSSESGARKGWGGAGPALAATVVVVYILISFLFAIWVPFPNSFDELAHVSAVREQVERPALFPDMRAYRMLDEADPARWSDATNYLNHPSPYYLAMSGFYGLTDAILPARAVNIALSVAALLLVVFAGWRHFKTAFGRIAFAVAAASFPKGPVIAAGVNNDNLAACAGAAVFAGMASAGGTQWWLAGGLALAGLTKLTALIPLAAVVGCRQIVRLIRRDTRWLSRENLIIAAGLAVGCIPYAANLLQMGQLLYVNEDRYSVAVEARPALDMIDYLGVFFTQLAMKWPASEYSLPLVLAVALMLYAPALAAATAARRDTVDVAIPYLAGLFVMLATHILFGWSSFQKMGDLTIAQARYYNVLWPGIAFAAALFIARLEAARPWTGVPLLVALLAPTVIGGIAVGLIPVSR